MKKKDQWIVGLTGAFGSGKSTAARLFKRMGARIVIDSDRLAREAFRPSHPLAGKIGRLFGIQKRLSRKKIAQEVFLNPRKLKALEAVIHPYVFRRIDSKLKQAGSGICVVEVPLLFESGFERKCDATIAIVSGKQAILRRLQNSRFEKDQIDCRFRAQLTESEKKRRADFWIDNSGSREVLRRRAKRLWNDLVLTLNQKSKSNNLRHTAWRIRQVFWRKKAKKE